MASFSYIFVEHKKLEEHGHGDIEPAVVRKSDLNEILAEQMKKSGIQCESLPIGSHPLERTPVYSHMFALSSKITTNKGLIKVRARNVDYVQVIQRN
ncbi:MAG TPA: hypothetical protein VJP79_01860 [Nitrososphaera sp.]|nr:hypothetical protein [Nitrososphaera sp.]